MSLGRKEHEHHYNSDWQRCVGLPQQWERWFWVKDIQKRRLCLLLMVDSQAALAWKGIKVISWGSPSAQNQHHHIYLLEHPTNPNSSQIFNFADTLEALQLKFWKVISEQTPEFFWVINIFQPRRRNMFLGARQKTLSGAWLHTNGWRWRQFMVAPHTQKQKQKTVWNFLIFFVGWFKICFAFCCCKSVAWCRAIKQTAGRNVLRRYWWSLQGIILSCTPSLELQKKVS